MSGVVTAVVGAAGAIGSAIIQGNAAKSAAQTQANAQDAAIQAQQQMFATIQGQEQPYMQAGNAAAAQLQGLVNGTVSSQQILNANPGYQFAKQQGMQGTINAAAGSSGALSGATQAALVNYNQGVAQQAYQNYYNQLLSTATLGQNAASNTGTQGVNLTGQTSQALSNIGSAQAAGQIGVANAASGALTGVAGAVGNLETMKVLGQYLPSTGSPNVAPLLGQLDEAGSPYVPSTILDPGITYPTIPNYFGSS